ncbi:ATP-binding protein [Pseudomonas asiatica]|uniref:ATP-binding protein n=1 Tax=Pseudomonas TaxID=286 RepID=UPI0012CDB6D8|nr:MULTISPECIES: ATP-binding protein [Pseudomonas]MCE0849490.1 ATP-binding protein [Pseudomonas asiatica]MPT16026.1 ATP-binding protein [Microbacterium sp.]
MPIGKPVTDTKAEPQSKEQAPSVLTHDFEVITPKYNLNDVVVNRHTKDEILSAIALRKDSEFVYKVLGFAHTHKRSDKFILNFYGEPGTGKTITAHAVAQAFGKNLLIVDYSQIESKYVGDTPKNLKNVFDFAKETDCVIFFDEADAILSRRVTNMTSATDTSVNQTRSVLLNILNDFSGILIFATNFISNYDPAFMRRIAKHIHFKLPDHDDRVALFKRYIPSALQESLDLEAYAQAAQGLSAADIENVTLMAAFKAAYKQSTCLSEEDVLSEIRNTFASKQANVKNEYTTTTRVVSKDYVEKQTGMVLE